MRKVAQGDRAAFVRIFEVYAPRIKGLMIRRGVPVEQAEDLAQETMVRVWRFAGSYDASKASASAWIFSIARNLQVDAFRQRKVAPVQDVAATLTEPQTPEEVLVLEDRTRDILQALAEIPDDQRAVLQMSFYEGLSHTEIARRLGMPLGTVKSRVRLALERVRRAMVRS